MLCMFCMDKGSSINLDLMNIGNCVVIMIILMPMCVFVCAIV